MFRAQRTRYHSVLRVCPCRAWTILHCISTAVETTCMPRSVAVPGGPGMPTVVILAASWARTGPPSCFRRRSSWEKLSSHHCTAPLTACPQARDRRRHHLLYRNHLPPDHQGLHHRHPPNRCHRRHRRLHLSHHLPRSRDLHLSLHSAPDKYNRMVRDSLNSHPFICVPVCPKGTASWTWCIESVIKTYLVA